MGGKKGKKRFFLRFLCILAVPLMGVGLYFAAHYNLLPQWSYSAEDFSIETIHSEIDYNQNGTDDYTDFLLGARLDAQNHPTYDGVYQPNGYPPDDVGVCTDVVWRAFKNAGYSLRDMVDQDILARREAYPNIRQRDSNIDFRRVVNLRIFLEAYALPLTLGTDEIAEWQPGDIIIFSRDKHIGIVSDKRTREGKPYIIHNGGQPNREENYLKRGEVTGHYRFNAQEVPQEVLVAWAD